MSKCERSRRPSLARWRYLRSVVHGLGYHELADGEAGGDGMAAAMSVVASNRVDARKYSFTPRLLGGEFLVPDLGNILRAEYHTIQPPTAESAHAAASVYQLIVPSVPDCRRETTRCSGAPGRSVRGARPRGTCATHAASEVRGAPRWHCAPSC